MEVTIFYFGEQWLWVNGDPRLIGVSHLKKWRIKIQKTGFTKMVKLGQIEKTV